MQQLTHALSGALVVACLAAISVADASVPAAPSVPQLSTDEIVRNLVAADQRRSMALRGLQAKRSYSIDYRGFPGARSASMQVDASYTAPDKKDFQVTSESGSKFLINHVFDKLLASEKDAVHDKSAIQLAPENYSFSFVKMDQTPYGPAYVLQLKPRTNNKYLYRGQIWVDAKDFAVVKIEAEPAKNPSFWISHTDIEQQYARFGEFWLPVHNRSVTHVRLGGEATLDIHYTDYRLNFGREASNAHPTPSSPVMPPAAAVSGDPH